ncbi:UNVERIFIED_ORG: hypothetical protein DFS12_101418 [Chitinophaga ginsengisegetis]|nr:hypothetical protein [Chitinophaga ginsengisegetis]MDR6645176.1 hypothetical protein [Chitinophaga ginsengisegetis]MDR6652232.1 hypothetical protein [Chitinophaga ginsengisegetis]
MHYTNTTTHLAQLHFKAPITNNCIETNFFHSGKIKSNFTILVYNLSI